MAKQTIKEYSPTPHVVPETIVGKLSKEETKDFDRYEFYQLVTMEKNIFVAFPELKQKREFTHYKPEFIKKDASEIDEICLILRFFSLVYNPESPLIAKYPDSDILKQKAADAIGWNYKDTSKLKLWDFVNDISNPKLLKLLSVYYAFMGSPIDIIKLRKMCMFQMLSQQNYKLVYSQQLNGDDKDLVETQKKKLDLFKVEYEILSSIAMEFGKLKKDSPVIAEIAENNLDLFNEYFNNNRNMSPEKMNKNYEIAEPEKEDGE